MMRPLDLRQATDGGRTTALQLSSEQFVQYFYQHITNQDERNGISFFDDYGLPKCFTCFSREIFSLQILSSRRIASSIETEIKSPSLNLIAWASSGFDKIKDQCSRTSRALQNVTAEQKLMTAYLGDFLMYAATDCFKNQLRSLQRLSEQG